MTDVFADRRLFVTGGLSKAGLPTALQLVGRWHDDRLLLDAAAKLENAIGFARECRMLGLNDGEFATGRA